MCSVLFSPSEKSANFLVLLSALHVPGFFYSSLDDEREHNESQPSLCSVIPGVPESDQRRPARSSTTASDKRHSDLGVGLSLVFLLAKTSDEFNKMAKVRAEMEALLREIKDEVRIKSGGADGNDAPKDRNRESTTSSCVTDGNDQSASLEYPAASSSSVDQASCEKSFEDVGCCASASMDVLEEELHAELELLQLNYGSDTPSFLPEEEGEEEEHYSEVQYMVLSLILH